jgi:hypothetical protein
MMIEKPIREPEQIRCDCAAKLRPIETSGMFTAILGCLLKEDWAEPRIEEMIVTDKCLLARREDQLTHKLFLGAEDDLIRNIHGIAKSAKLDGDELGYLLGAVAKLRRIE